MYAAALLIGCNADPEIITARLALDELASCELPPPSSLRVRATGDFPAQEQLLPGVAPYDLEPFAAEARYLVIEARSGPARAGSVVALDPLGLQRRALLLPLGRSCPLGDPLVAARPESALAALPGGGLLIAGGRIDADANGSVGSALVLRPSEELANEVPGGMLLRRAGASATVAGAAVVIAGGAPDRRGPAHDTFEVYSLAEQRFDTARSARLRGPRRDHGAGRLPDGRVLLVGGVAESEGEPLASAELIDLGAGESRAVQGELAHARTAPALLVLDSGVSLVALGRDAAEQPVAELERFDPSAERFEPAGALPVHAEAAVAALPGGRVLYAGCEGPGEPCELGLLLPAGERFELWPLGASADALEAAGLRGLDQLRAAALGDGRVLLTGRDPRLAVARRAFVIDPNGPSVEPADATRVPSQLIALEGGVIAELDAEGASLHRELLQSAFDDPPEALLSAPDPVVSLDLRERWEVGDRGLAALADARLDLAGYEFAAVAIELVLEGTGELLLADAGQAPAVVAIDDASARLGNCRIARSSDDPLRVVRHGTRVELQSGGQRTRCEAPGLSGHVTIAVRLRAASRLTALRVDRL